MDPSMCAMEEKRYNNKNKGKATNRGSMHNSVRNIFPNDSTMCSEGHSLLILNKILYKMV